MKNLFNEWAKNTLGKIAWQNRRVSIEELGVDKVITATGTTGNQTINATAGTVNFAAAATTLTVTNSYAKTTSLIFIVIQNDDTTAVVKNVAKSNGSFIIKLNAAATAETSVAFFIIN